MIVKNRPQSGWNDKVKHLRERDTSCTRAPTSLSHVWLEENFRHRIKKTESSWNLEVSVITRREITALVEGIVEGTAIWYHWGETSDDSMLPLPLVTFRAPFSSRATSYESFFFLPGCLPSFLPSLSPSILSPFSPMHSVSVRDFSFYALSLAAPALPSHTLLSFSLCFPTDGHECKTLSAQSIWGHQQSGKL